VSAIRADGTTIETTSWTDGPAPAEPLVAKTATVKAAGALPPPIATVARR
jgi:hypothetical protein